MSLRCRFTFIEELDVQDCYLRRSRSCPPAFNHADTKAEKRAMMLQMAQLEVRVQQLRSEPSRCLSDPNPKLQANAMSASASFIENPGSYRHPQLCNRPCIHFVKGECKLAEECDMCHLPHVKFTKFDMRQRQLLATLPKSTLLSTILPHLQQRVQEHGLHQAMDIVEMVERELSFQLPDEASSIGSNELKRISKVLEGMPLAALIGVVSSKHIRGAFPRQIREALIQLRAHLSFP